MSCNIALQNYIRYEALKCLLPQSVQKSHNIIPNNTITIVPYDETPNNFITDANSVTFLALTPTHIPTVF